MIRIVEIGEIAAQGRTEPVHCRSDDGHEYFVKGRFAGARALVCEWVANRLGKLLGLPIPDFAQMYLTPELWQFSVKRAEVERLGKGTLFGSKRIHNLVELRESDIQLIDPKLKARVLAFDWWVANGDRVFIDGAGNPNLLWNDQSRELVVIDHNLAFDESLTVDFWKEHVFRTSRDLWSAFFRDEMSTSYRNALKDLGAIWSELPEDWLEAPGIPTLAEVEALLWRFDRESDIFWRLS